MEPFDDRGKFEKAISLTFDGAQIAPDPRIWDKIDATLAKDKNSSYRKRLFIFQLVAAASILFAATITLYLVFKNDTIPAQQTPVTEQVEAEKEPEPSPTRATPEEAPVITPKTGDKEEVQDQNEELLTEKEPTRNIIKEEQVNKPQIAQIHQQEEIQNIRQQWAKDSNIVDKEDRPGGQWVKNGVLEIQISPAQSNVLTSLKHLNLLFVPAWVKPDGVKIKDDLWASAGFAAGSYTPSAGGFGLSFGAADALETASPTQDGSSGPYILSDEQSGRSVGAGVGFGGRLSRKWSLESGLSYVHSEIDGTTNSFIESNGRSFPVFYETNFAGSLQNTTTFGVTNSLDFVSIPIKAGYVLVDKKIGWIATAGFGSNILVGNSLQADLGQLEKVNYSVSDSPYRRLSWSGIIGTELFFNLTEDYQLMIVPQYNFGITAITRQESAFSIVPNSLNVGIRFRYLLK